MADQGNTKITIDYLPEEVISIILSKSILNCQDVLNFSLTCKKYYTLVKCDQSIWKNQLQNMMTTEMFNVILKNGYGDWLSNITNFYQLQKNIMTNLTQMSPKFYRMTTEMFNVILKNGYGDWLSNITNFYQLQKNIMTNLTQMSPKFYRYKSDIAVPAVINYFELAFTNNINFFLTISILYDFIKTAKKHLDRNDITNKLYSLTTLRYAKVVLSHMIHMYLMVKWTLMCRDMHVVPEMIVNFFVQWIDTSNIYLDEYIDSKINELVIITEKNLDKNHPLKSTPTSVRATWTKNLISKDMWNVSQSKEVLNAVTTAIYKHNRMAIAAGANIDTLDIVKVLNLKCGNATAVAAVYAAVARRCGVRCDLIAFPNHLFLEWVGNSMIVNIPNGELEKKRQCPFSQANNSKIDYNHHALLRHLIKVYNQTMGSIRHGGPENVEHLLNFLERTYYKDNPYRNYNRYLEEVTTHPIYRVPFDIKNLDAVFRGLISYLAKYNESKKPANLRDSIVKKHDGSVKFAIGMMCFHTKYQYVCIICGWDTSCTASKEWQSQMSIHTLDFGAKQPFYNVIAADYSERYVAQENLREVREPHRIYHLEDELAREFSHFDGFAYIPNDEKAAEYPEDGHIREFYRSKTK